MITSRLCSEARTSIPRPVRVALGLSEGDTLVYELLAGRVYLRRQEDVDTDSDAGATGLPVQSVVRTPKVATVDAEHGEVVGRVGPATLATVTERVLELIRG